MQTIQVYQVQTDNFFDLSDVTFLNEQIGLASGGIPFDTAVVVKTVDGGAHWTKVKFPSDTATKLRLKAIEKNQHGEMVAVGEKGCCIYSSDKDESWKEFSRFTQANLESIYWLDANTFFVVGEGGLIFKLVL